jgi:Ni/Fe-hydrogenase subunit HybB-like protein
MSAHDVFEATRVRWQRDTPVNIGPIVSYNSLFLAALSAVGLAFAVVRFCSPLGKFSAMTNAYAWGIWKTFNVMTLTALGSAPLGVGIAEWVFRRHRLHAVMRTAVLSGFLIYAAGLLGLCFDVGRAWNFWNILLPWRWNKGSAMLEISVCMPLYCVVFLLFELIPMGLERLESTGSPRTRANLIAWEPTVHKIYPYVLTCVYVVPLMHQSSLGGLLLLLGNKIHPLWQTPFLPLLYLLAAILCGIAFLTVLLLVASLHYGRPVDIVILRDLGDILSWVSFVFLLLCFADLLWRKQLAAAFAFDAMSLLFLLETGLILVPAVALRLTIAHQSQRGLFLWCTLSCSGGLLYRYIPTTIAFFPAPNAVYFPSVIELLMSVGYAALSILGFVLGAKFFSVLPGIVDHPSDTSFRSIHWQRPEIFAKGKIRWHGLRLTR